MMGTKEESWITGCLIYYTMGELSRIAVYTAGALHFAIRGELVLFLGWIFLGGPLVGFLVRGLWPLFGILWISRTLWEA
jgi:hypothetical protein